MSSLLVPLTDQLRARQELSAGNVAQAAEALAAPEVPEMEKADFLGALAAKGETAGEVAAFARAFREKAVTPGVERWSDEAIDIVGTGGDHAGGFNISSIVVLVLASLGVKVMKHGNRGITSRCGSADLLAGLGVKIDAPAEVLRQSLDELGYAFFFAPAYHPAFKHIAPVRKALAAKGQRTVFNIIGPLINPGRPAHVLLGVFSENWVSRLGEVLDLLGCKAGLAAHGSLAEGRGIDELTTATPNRVRGIGRLRGIDGWWEPDAHGFVRGEFEELKGGDVAENLALTERILTGNGPRALVDTIVLNAATALWILGRTASIQEGTSTARDALLGGAVRAKIEATQRFYAQHGT